MRRSELPQNSPLAWSDIPLRLALAATFIFHGLQKFSGGLEGFAGMLTQLGVPAPQFMAWVVAIAELGGGILVLFGLLTRLGAFAIFCDMAVAIATVHIHQGFMTRSGPGQFPMGFEWQFALVMIALSLVIRGAGVFSLDHLIRRRFAEEAEYAEAPAATASRRGRAVASTQERTEARSIGVPPRDREPEERPPAP